MNEYEQNKKQKQMEDNKKESGKVYIIPINYDNIYVLTNISTIH